jgi:hypothetical protein
MKKFLLYCGILMLSLMGFAQADMNGGDTFIEQTIVSTDGGHAVLAGAMGMHYFSRSTKAWQGSVSTACLNFDDCAFSGALGKRDQSFLWTASAAINRDDHMVGGSFGWTFSKRR